MNMRHGIGINLEAINLRLASVPKRVAATFNIECRCQIGIFFCLEHWKHAHREWCQRETDIHASRIDLYWGSLQSLPVANRKNFRAQGVSFLYRICFSWLMCIMRTNWAEKLLGLQLSKHTKDLSAEIELNMKWSIVCVTRLFIVYKPIWRAIFLCEFFVELFLCFTLVEQQKTNVS